VSTTVSSDTRPRPTAGGWRCRGLRAAAGRAARGLAGHTAGRGRVGRALGLRRGRPPVLEQGALDVDVRATLTPPGVFCMDNHWCRIEADGRLTMASMPKALAAAPTYELHPEGGVFGRRLSATVLGIWAPRHCLWRPRNTQKILKNRRIRPVHIVCTHSRCTRFLGPRITFLGPRIAIANLKFTGWTHNFPVDPAV
jgi:hypothetical protein